MVEIAAVGDMMLARSIKSAVDYFKDVNYPFRETAHLLQTADVALGNLECVITDKGAAAVKRFAFRAEPRMIDALTFAGFDVLTLANNHAMDYDPEALLDTLARLSEAGIAHVGAGADEITARQPAIIERHGLSIAFLGYMDVPDGGYGLRPQDMQATERRPGVAWARPEAIGADVRGAKARADVVIVLLHSGYEFRTIPNETQRTAAHAAIDAGAAAVIGAHPHVLQGVEHYRGGVIAYSLGNFVFDMAESVNLSAVLRLRIGREGVIDYMWQPIVIERTGQPRPAPPAPAARILRNLERMTRDLNPEPEPAR